MYADPKELKRMRRRVERRVRGKVLYLLHLGVAGICTALAILAVIFNFFSGYLFASGYGLRAVMSPLQVVMFFTFTLGIHTLLRWLNRTAQQMRDAEMQRELQLAGYYGEVEKRKYEAQVFARLSDDGELIYSAEANDEYEQALSRTK
jgi:hypothetical protein